MPNLPPIRAMEWPILFGTATLALGLCYFHPFTIPQHSEENEPGKAREQELSDHPLLIDHSTIKPYKTAHARYPCIRTFYRPHAHREKLQAISDLPLLVFIHGLGGSLPQFASLLCSLVNIAPCFGIELPGHGRSGFDPQDYSAYTIQAFTALWAEAIRLVCMENGHKRVVLVGHSMGCSIAALLATQDEIKVEVAGIVALCPKSNPPTESQSKTFRRLLWLPDWVLDTFRWYDRRGGEDSVSVKRFVGDGGGVDLKRLQLSFNEGFKTPVWKRSALGCLPLYDAQGKTHGGLPGRETWSRVRASLLLIAGEADTISKPVEMAEIVSYLQHEPSPIPSRRESIVSEPLPVSTDSTKPDDLKDADHSMTADDRSYGLTPTVTNHQTLTSHSSAAIKTAILPSPASHALMYDHANYRTVAGLTEDFLARHVDPSMSLGWQLQKLTTSGKWDVKNLEKWQRTLAVSAPIPKPPSPSSRPPLSTNSHNKSYSLSRHQPSIIPDTTKLPTSPSQEKIFGLFRALKTLREQDPIHTPSKFVSDYHTQIYAVIDISHDAPVYDTSALERGGIEYHKFPTVSKVPPTVVEVKDFIALVDRLRAEMDEKASISDRNQIQNQDQEQSQSQVTTDKSEPSPPTIVPPLSPPPSSTPPSNHKKAIAVHCHYGYNRTGFFICSYLIERLGFSVDQALEEFKAAKPPGIKHEHFIDTLFVRYCFGLKKAPTLKTGLGE